MKISVIIPVYNVEKYIEKCIRSLFNQSLKDGIEYIIIDDCSPDRSIEIIQSVLNDFPHRKNQVRILRHAINKGVSNARKFGCEVASGDYVIHCDPDDWVDPEMYQLLCKKAIETGADIIGCDYYEHYDNNAFIRKQHFNLSSDEILTEMLNVKPRKIGLYLWNRLIKKSFICQTGIEFLDNVTLWEDVAYLLALHSFKVSIEYVDKPLYHYNRTNQGSAVSIFRKEHSNSLLIVGEYLRDIYSTISLSDVQKINLNNRLLRCKLPLITETVSFEPEKWRTTLCGLKVMYYPSIKMRILMILATYRFDTLLKVFLHNG